MRGLHLQYWLDVTEMKAVFNHIRHYKPLLGADLRLMQSQKAY